MADNMKNTERLKDDSPYRGKTCFIQRVDRIKVKVELGFDVSVVSDFKVYDLDVPSDIDVEAVKGCLIVLIGGHSILVQKKGKPYHGVYPAKFFLPCDNPPEGVESALYKGKPWMNLGEYLNHCYQEFGLEPQRVKEDYLARRS